MPEIQHILHFKNNKQIESFSRQETEIFLVRITTGDYAKHIW